MWLCSQAATGKRVDTPCEAMRAAGGLLVVANPYVASVSQI